MTDESETRVPVNEIMVGVFPLRQFPLPYPVSLTLNVKIIYISTNY